MDELLKKLQVKGTSSLKLINRPADVKISGVRGSGTKVMLVFAKNKLELDQHL